MLTLIGSALGRLADWITDLIPDDLFDCWLDEDD